MHQKFLCTGLVLLCIFLATAGCTGTQGVPAAPAAPQQTAAPSSTAAPAPAAATDLNPSPTDAVIDANRVTVNVEKDYLAGVTFTFQGGNGLQQVNRIDVTLIRSDGLVKNDQVGIRVGDSVTLEGTKSTDRGVVTVTMKDGKTYKIVDTLLPYRTRQ